MQGSAARIDTQPSQPMTQGDFTQLAKNYHHRVGYSFHVIQTLAKLQSVATDQLEIADVGAGTGKLTEVLAQLHPKQIHAIEPNHSMREAGIQWTKDLAIQWADGSAEKTPLTNESVDWALMGSSFHWANLKSALKEFHRILRPGGALTVVWNPRDKSRSPMETQIDEKIRAMVPNLKRKSSGSKEHSDDWYSKLVSTGEFKDVLFVEAPQQISLSKERYLGIWHSVNDIRAQAGEAVWQEILSMIEEQIASQKQIIAHYLTRSWTVWKA